MHIKIRRTYALLYRSTWVPKAANGNTHGFSQQRYVGSIPLTAAAIPDALQSKLTADELAFVESKICTPARQRAEEEQQAAEVRERDPAWRVEEALCLLGKAAEKSAAEPVAAAKAVALQEALARIKTDGAVSPTTMAGKVADDPLHAALCAVREAAQAVATGRYGKAPGEQVRATRTYRLWADLWEAVEGETEGSLLRALQDRGFVKRRGG
uniref:Uncharacterized protein n=1 Tax=mine drainage metagenome TaxID=410659 RepID=E6PTE5_9ZZZZ